MSSPEDFRRYIEDRYPAPAAVDEERLKLRLGQRLLARMLTSTSPRSLFVEFPTGYGKTRCGVVASYLLRLRAGVTHTLILVPSDEQRTKWLEDCRDEFKLVTGEPVEAWDGTDPAAIGYFNDGTVRVFVATIQSAIGPAGAAIISQLLKRGTWLVIIDEAQYYASDADASPWSFGLKGILDRPNVRHWLAMSATPLRRDKKYGYLGSPDLVVPIALAKNEHAIRPPRIRAEEYTVDLSTGDGEVIESVQTSEIERWAHENGGDGSITAWEIRRRVRYYGKFLSKILEHTLDLWNAKERRWPSQNQILVFAMSVRHAKHLAGEINRLVGQPGFADYIGDTADPEASRKPEENEFVLTKFKANNLPCLVQVAKAGVGFDNKRCSVLCFLNVLSPTPLLLQFIGRGLRRNGDVSVEEDVCDIVVSLDHPGMEMFRKLEEEVGEDPAPGGEPDIGCGGGPTGPRFREIPEFFLIDASFRHAEIIEPLGSEVREAAERLLGSVTPEARLAITRVSSDGGDLLDLIAKALRAERQQEQSVLTLKAQHEQANIQANDAARQVVANTARLLFPGVDRIDSGVRAKLFSAVHGQWIKTGGVRQPSATVEDLRAKHEWLTVVNEQLRSGVVPLWLRIRT